ncbi:cytochrome c biogenesis protein CcdA [Salicibibacter cibarius]|uniref:Cytochrome c biogenesis protein CcdA n=2 Tax=Salicibibacter TaxID=2685905 RepID=A0A514LK91_9BACI|nr:MULTISPECIES: cytochrome c biogenesis protein CcdA [Salicibibacter]QDI91955.1 cytochrome c biogenesis protein CcdA [Salicibibacter halophilus]QQK74490.1 cytochrome c biogenesis protein CcdA [Salicibibacter cibarius]
MDDVSLGIAFIAGLISFFSPCVFPLLPAYLAQLTGGNISSEAIDADRKLIFSRSIGFIIGFTIIFLLLGLSSTLLGSLFRQYSEAIMQLGGIIIILFGLQMSGIITIRALLSEKKVAKTPKKSTSFTGSVGFGLVFAAGWMPCIGIVLGSILTLAGTSGSMLAGSSMLFVYSMGLGVPFMGVSLLYAKSFQKLSSIHRFLPAVQKISGIIMIVLGILLFTGYFQTISMYLGQFVPSWMI